MSSQRSASRDDVFLSALDLFSILLFTFMALAFRARLQGANGTVAQIGLPIASRDVSEDLAPDTHYMRWGSHYGAGGTVCNVELLGGASVDSLQPIRSFSDVPCQPSAFSSRSEISNSVGLAHHATTNGQPLVLLCPRSQGLEACARLQWVASEHGIVVVAAVSDGD